MSKEKKQRKSKKFRLFVAANVFIFFFLVLAFGREYVASMQIEREIRELEAERSELEGEKLETLDLIDQLSSEYYLEAEARIKHGLGREGETLVVIENVVENENGSKESDSFSDSLVKDGVANPIRWFYYFFDHETFETLGML